jgi:hypothetical protein
MLSALISALALVAGACSGSAATATPTASLTVPVVASSASAAPAQPSTAPTTSTTAAAAAASTSAPASAPPSSASQTPTSLPAVSSFVIPSFTSDKQLEAELPDTYQGAKLTKTSVAGAQAFSDGSPTSKDFLALLASFGKTPADVSFAFAYGPSTQNVTFIAYRIKGLDASAWTPAFYQFSSQLAPGTTASQANLGGKSVERIVSPKSTELTFSWTKGDVLFIVLSTTDALAGPAIAAMP